MGKRKGKRKPPKPPGKRGGKLTPQQERFVQEYLIDLCGTAAAKRAGYSARSAGRYSIELLQKPHVQQAIQAARAEQAQRTGITADQVVEKLAAIALTDIRELLEWNGARLAVKPSEELSPEAAYLLAGIEFDVVGGDGENSPIQRIKVRLNRREKALELLMRHLGMIDNRIQVDGLEKLADALMEARQRVRRG